MSKISNDTIREGISKILGERKKRKFVETVDLQVMLRDYDPNKDKRFNATCELNYPCRSNMKICLVGTVNHIDQAKGEGIDFKSLDDLKKFNRDAKEIKKWARRYDTLLVSESIAKNVTRTVGRYITSIGKIPVQISDSENVKDKIQELMCTIRFRVKKYPWLGQGVGIDTLGEEEIRGNVTKALNFLASQLPKGWHNFKSVHMKTTMGKPFRLL